MGWASSEPIYTLGMGGVEHIIICSFKNLTSRLSIEGLNIFLSFLEVGFSATQTQAFFDKLPKLTYFDLLR